MQCIDISGHTARQAGLSKDAPTCSNTASTRLWRGNIDSAWYVEVGFTQWIRTVWCRPSAAATLNLGRPPQLRDRPVVLTPRLLQSNNTACVRAALSLDDTAAGFAQCCHVHVKVIECDSASSNKTSHETSCCRVGADIAQVESGTAALVMAAAANSGQAVL